MILLSGTALFVLWFSHFDISIADNAREGRITGAEKAEPHSHPYMVSLQGHYKWKRYRVCGGTIVSKRWILSAGHCVTDYWSKWLPMDAIVGTHSLDRIYSDDIYSISKRIAHPYYKGGVGPYDIAMFKTEREIQYSDRVQPIMLPQMRQEFRRDERLTITGWGALYADYFTIVRPNKLREADVYYLPYYDCYRAVNKFADYYEKNPLRKEFNLCTGPLYEGVAGCTGDSGGPLIRYMIKGDMTTESTTMGSSTTEGSTTSSTTTESSNGMMPVQVGIISWGIVPCGIKGAPTVYTNVSRHMDFINKYINK